MRKMQSKARPSGLLLDLDGVIYHGSKLVPGAPEFFRLLDSVGFPYACVTNNSSRTPRQIAARLSEMGVEVSPQKVVTSAVATARYLELHAQPGALVCAIGEEGIFSALAASGFILTERSPEYVVVGLDRSLDLYRLGTAIKAIRNGACFIATNGDPVIVTERGFEPGTGSIVAAVASETGRIPIVIGKPSHWLFELGISRLAPCARTRVAMLGDDIETDVKGAQSLGLITALVLTGKTSRSVFEQSGIAPDYVFDDLNHLMKIWFS